MIFQSGAHQRKIIKYAKKLAKNEEKPCSTCLKLHMPELSHFRGRGKSCAKLITEENWCEILHFKKSQIWPICGNF